MRRIAIAGWMAAVGLGLVAMLPIGVAAQTVTLSGTVVRAAEGTPVAGATVRFSGLPSVVTGRDGRFELREVPPGHATLIVQAIGYQLRLIDLTVHADTTLRIALDRIPVQLDTVRAIAGTVTINGRVRDAATHRRVLQGEVRVYPGGRTVGIFSGGFRITGVPRDSVTLVVEGFEHLPAEVTLAAAKDTSIVVELAIDSVALAMEARQVARLTERARAVPLGEQLVSGDDVLRSGVMTLSDFVDRHLMQGKAASRGHGSTGRCLFYDDISISPEQQRIVLATIPLETLARVEIYGSSGQMIRVYTTRYVASLARTKVLPRIVYMPIGLSLVCY